MENEFRLIEVRLTNVRSIATLRLPLICPSGESRQWTLLIGENGSGKSTVLRAIAMFLVGTDGFMQLVGKPASWVRRGMTSCSIEIDILLRGRKRPLKLNIQRTDSASDILKRHGKLFAFVDELTTRSRGSSIIAGYGVTRRLSGDIPFEGMRKTERTDPRADAVASLFFSDATLHPIRNWVIELDYRRGKEGLEVVRKVFDHLLPNVRFIKVDKKNGELLFKTSDGVVPLGQLSDGYKNMIAWTGDLMYRITNALPKIRDPFRVGGLLIIDEIDLHLHPVWQRMLREYLSRSFSRFQIIATTHSVLTAQQGSANELFVFKRLRRRNSATLCPYEGAPDRLMVHQLLLGGLFGPDDVRSPFANELRDEYLALKRKPQRTKVEQKRLTYLYETLSDYPDWTSKIPAFEKTNRLLKKLEQSIAARK